MTAQPGRPIPVADKAIAEVTLKEICKTYADAYDVAPDGVADLDGLAAFLIECTSKVRFQPSTRQLVLTFDLDMSGAADQSQTGPEGS